MNNFDYEPIHNQDDYGSSAFIFDLRNSTTIIRKISWDERLLKHIDFMMKLHETVYETLFNNCDRDKFAMNDTGDGYLCVFWDELHALTCLDMAIRIQEFLESNLPRHNKTLNLKDDIAKFDYGFAIHSGGSTINRTIFTKNAITISKDFIFGVVINTVARLESFTKNYIDFKFLVTGNYKETYQKQAKNKSIKNLINNKSYVHKSLGRVNIKDGKENSNIRHKGHIVYALSTDFIAKLKEFCPLTRHK